MLKKSAGEKSSMFIRMIFDLIEKDLSNSINILMILDQPEDNIDNDNIYNQIADRIKKLKLKYNNFQSLIVTHNANVGITADSENIIIAKEILNDDSSKQFLYEPGCIENKSFIKEVCDILEGGKIAMERRTIKYGINIIILQLKSAILQNERFFTLKITIFQIISPFPIKITDFK